MSEPDDRWLLLRERGGDVAHVPARTRARYDQLAELIRALPGEAPSAGWKARILAAIDESPADPLAAMGAHKRRCPVWLNRGALAVAGPCVVAIAVFCLVAMPRPAMNRAVLSEASISSKVVEEPTSPDDTLFTMAIRRDSKPARLELMSRTQSPGHMASASRAEYALVGDTLVLHAKTDRGHELRVYGDAGEPLGRCTSLLDCSLEMIGDVAWLRLEVPLRARGQVRVILLTGNSIFIPFQNRYTDLGAASSAHVKARHVQTVFVD